MTDCSLSFWGNRRNCDVLSRVDAFALIEEVFVFVGVERDGDCVFSGWQCAEVIPVAVESGDFFTVDVEVSVTFGCDVALIDTFWCKLEVGGFDLDVPTAHWIRLHF